MVTDMQRRSRVWRVLKVDMYHEFSPDCDAKHASLKLLTSPEHASVHAPIFTFFRDFFEILGTVAVTNGVPAPSQRPISSLPTMWSAKNRVPRTYPVHHFRG